jgi:tRNA threonylcarbamoyladenosine biosynthesis protein TsaB
MRILAIETSHRSGSVAVLEKGKVLGEKFLPADVPTTRSLHPAIQELLPRVGWRPKDVQLIATTVGPGSFTGLRVGVTTAKVFAYAVGAEVLGLDTLEVIAHRTPQDYREVHTVVDAQRGEVVAGSFRRNPQGHFEIAVPPALVPFERWVLSLPPRAALTGPALARYPLPDGTSVEVLPQDLWIPTAAALGELAWIYWCAGRRDDLWGLLPKYARVSYAEEKLR